MKIIHVVWTFKNGGIETMLINIINQQIKVGHKVGLLIVNSDIDNELIKALDEEVELYKVNRKQGSKSIFSLLKANYYYFISKASVVHFHFINISDLFLLKGNRTWFNTIHTTKINTNPFKNRIDIYIAISNTVKQILQHKYKLKKVELCFNAIDFNRISLKKIYCEKIFKIICVARVEFSLKGQDVIIKAMKLLKEEYNGQMNVDFVGDGSDMEKLKKMVVDNHLENEINIIGNKSNDKVLKSLKEYDLFIQASRFEGFGLTAIEAMATGLPVVLSNVGGHIEVSSNGKNGLLFESNNELDLCNKILECNSNYSVYVKIAKNARNEVKENFSIEDMVDNMDNIYKLTQV